jgi:hypothetical protein
VWGSGLVACNAFAVVVAVSVARIRATASRICQAELLRSCSGGAIEQTTWRSGTEGANQGFATESQWQGVQVFECDAIVVDTPFIKLPWVLAGMLTCFYPGDFLLCRMAKSGR